jgi:CheY-like chemotaxis protein
VAPPAASAGRRTVLVVDDDPGILNYATTVLTGAGYAVLQAGDGLAALAVWEQHGPAIDLVLTDLEMPNLGGRELADQLRRRRPGLPVLFMSGNHGAAGGGGGVFPFLPKPFSSNDLVRRVGELLGG